MKKLLSYILSAAHLILFGFLLLVFYPVQIICKNVGGYKMHKKSVDVLAVLLCGSLRVLGSKISFKGFPTLPENRPLIIISNHQSSYDIPVITWRFRRHHPKFISKIELAKGIPSISYNLKHGGSAVIDRKNAQQSVREIFNLGYRIKEKNYAACIFPEGTRSKNGKMKKFQVSGIRTLLKAAPNALIVPFVIDGNYKIHKYGKFPLSIGEKLTYTTLEPIEPKKFTPDELVEITEQAIKKTLNQN